ncbi:hypothetical protein ACFE04_026434 [Oxalis oulophora]
MLVSSLDQYLPRWLQVFLSEKFFNSCIIHQNLKKNEKNIFCLDCCITICTHCVSPHSSHRLFQIRRYVYHDVLRLDDACQLIDCSDIQINYLIKTQNGGLANFLFDCNFLVPLPEQNSHDSVIEPADSAKTCSGSIGSDEFMGLSACRPVSLMMNMSSRRKKTPQRAPLH